MNKFIFLKLKLLFVSLCFSSITIYSQNFDTRLNLQDSTQTHVILLKNEKRIKGRILEIKNEKVFFQKKNKKKTITLTLSEIQEIKVSGHTSWDKKKYAEPFKYSQYLFYTNTGFGLKEDEKSYRTFMGASLLRDRGLSNFISVGMGYSFPFLLHANVKFSTPNPRNGSSSFKSSVILFPLSFTEAKLFIFENSIAHSFGTPDRFFNINASSFYISEKDIFSSRTSIPKIYYSISLGGGIRINENWQLMIENHINFNENFIDGKLLPSFGFNYATSKYNVGFGFHSPNNLGFNLYPIIEFNDDAPFAFTPHVLSKLPFFTFSKIF